MMNLILILAFSAVLPSSIVCGTIARTSSDMKARPPILNQSLPPSPLLASHSKNYNSSHPASRNLDAREKREIPAEANDVLFPDYRISEMMPKRAAAGLNKIIYVLRNSFDKAAPSSPENDENDNFSGDINRALVRGSSVDRFPAALVERRGQAAQKDRKIYLRCYFNAVSCFRKKK
ncbi:uncharacterized protein LOC110847702 isoform X2 [Folsomia candida]|uniref:uncharacterized protein LOC110847702 isoform X2 n=1 Tax=Folsomia candida TaxID=158441 RepID=UPI000B8FDA49|nr:uncharacterized protein LOC110847702 isoform X2 [Folsomia candida]